MNRVKVLGVRRVLLNDSSQSRWEKHTVYQTVTKNHTGSYWILVHRGTTKARSVPVQRLYADTPSSALTGKMRLSNNFMAVGKV